MKSHSSATPTRFARWILIKYLMDTNVVSSLAPSKGVRPPEHSAISEWIIAHSDALFLSVVSAIEIEAGLMKLERSASGAWQEQMSQWFSSILFHYQERILPLDIAVARIASRMTDKSKARGLYPGIADVAIGATAVAHRQILLTRNRKHFEALEIELLDPFEQLPP